MRVQHKGIQPACCVKCVFIRTYGIDAFARRLRGQFYAFHGHTCSQHVDKAWIGHFTVFDRPNIFQLNGIITVVEKLASHDPRAIGWPDWTEQIARLVEFIGPPLWIRRYLIRQRLQHREGCRKYPATLFQFAGFPLLVFASTFDLKNADWWRQVVDTRSPDLA